MKRTLTYLGHLICATALLALSGIAAAQTYPAKPIRFIVPFPPGGGADVMARLLGPTLAEVLGQNVLVDNRPGAAGNIGVEIGVKSPPDGYTVIFAYSGTVAINPSLYSRLPFSASDFAPITWLALVPQIVVVHPSLPVRNIKELIAFAKAKPDELTYASAGSGAFNHMAGELFKMMSGVQIVHVPYKGGGPASLALLTGEVSMILGEPAGVLPHIRAGKLRALAVTSARRFPAMPDLPTVADTGLPGYEVISWNGVLAPAGTPQDIIAKLNAAFVKAIRAPQLRDKLLASGFEPVGSTPEEFGTHIRAETAKWAKVVKATGMKID